MTEAPFTQLQDLSTALAGLVASTAPSVTAVHSHHSRSTAPTAALGINYKFDLGKAPVAVRAAY